MTKHQPTWCYENDPSEPVWIYSALSKSGADQLATTMVRKFGCTLIEKPFMRTDGIWAFMFSNPLKGLIYE